MLKQVQDLVAQMTLLLDLLLEASLFIKKQLKEPSLASLLLQILNLTHGKESRSQILQEKPTSCQTGNFTTAETTCLSTKRRRQPSTLTREEQWLITKERRLTLCLLLTRRQSRIFLRIEYLRLDFIVILTLPKISSTLTISSLTLKHGSILDNGSTILM